MNDIGDFVLEIDKLIRSERSNLVHPPLAHAQPSNPQTDCYNQVTPPIGSNPNSVIQHLNNRKPTPTLWETSPPFQAYPEHMPESPNHRGQDMRQVRLFKTRFCSYGLECPYLAKGKCLYAHSKDEIRCRPPPPTKQGSNRSVNDSTDRGHSVYPDQSPTGSTESVWSLPDSPLQAPNVSSASREPNQEPNKRHPSLFDCLVGSEKAQLPYSHSQPTMASSSLSSFLGLPLTESPY